jgi:hypothetical protein
MDVNPSSAHRDPGGVPGDSYVIGVDFGTLSGRALVVRVGDGAEMGTAVHEYANGGSRTRSRRPGSHCPRTGRCRTPTTTARCSGGPSRRRWPPRGSPPIG